MTKITQFFFINSVQIRSCPKFLERFAVGVQSKINKIRISPDPVQSNPSPVQCSSLQVRTICNMRWDQNTRDEQTVKFFRPSPFLFDKIESDPVLIRKIFEIHQSDPVLIRQCKIMHFYFASWGKNYWSYFAFSQIWLVEGKIVPAMLLIHEAK